MGQGEKEDVTMATDAEEPACGNGMDEDRGKEENGEEKKDEEMDGDKKGDEVDIPPAERVALATSHKEMGNDHLKRNDFKEAVTEYVTGIKLVESLLEKTAPEVEEEEQKQAVAVYTSLNLNASQAYLKLEEWEDAAKMANAVLIVDKSNVKALYRKGVAHHNAGQLENSKQELSRLVELDPQNKAARQELLQVREKLKLAKEAEKKRLSAVFSGGGLYKEQHRKDELDQEQWKIEQAQRREKEEEEQSFEDWRKARDEKQKEEKKKQEEARKEAEKERRKQAKEEEEKSPNRKQEDVVMCSDEDLDAEELAILKETKAKGYYHGRLGTVLSNEAPTPQSIERPATAEGQRDGAGGSAWNAAGTTWEEADVSSKTRDVVKATLQEVEVGMDSDGWKAQVIKVGSVTGDSTRAVIRGRARLGYELKAELTGQIQVLDESTDEWATHKVKLSLPDISDHSEAEIRIDASWKGAKPPENHEKAAGAALAALRQAIRGALVQCLSTASP